MGWERDGKGASLMQFTGCRDVTAMSPCDGSGQTETQSDARQRSTLVPSVESIKDSREIDRGDAEPRIFDRDGKVSSVNP